MRGKMRRKVSKYDRFLLGIMDSRRIIADSKLRARGGYSRRSRIPQTWRRTLKQRSGRISALLVTALLSMLVLAGTLWFVWDNSWSTTVPNGNVPRTAALVDELSATVPDLRFLENVNDTLARTGYHLHYYGPSAVTVGFFRILPSIGYDLVIIRAHSGDGTIYTSEPYSKSSYVYEQLTDQIVPAQLDRAVYFAITEKFVESSMHGKFNNALIVTMGCSGLASTGMAQAFLERGAKSYVGWDRAVSPRQTDTEIDLLVRSLAQGVTVKEAVGLAQARFAGDSSFQSRLAYYDQSTVARAQAGVSLEGLGGLVAVVLVMCTGPLVVVLVPRLLGKH